jgi:hypothetical protein
VETLERLDEIGARGRNGSVQSSSISCFSFLIALYNLATRRLAHSMPHYGTAAPTTSGLWAHSKDGAPLVAADQDWTYGVTRKPIHSFRWALGRHPMARPARALLSESPILGR